MWISYAVLAVCVVLLLSGKSVERTLERFAWALSDLLVNQVSPPK